MEDSQHFQDSETLDYDYVLYHKLNRQILLNIILNQPKKNENRISYNKLTFIASLKYTIQQKIFQYFIHYYSQQNW